MIQGPHLHYYTRVNIVVVAVDVEEASYSYLALGSCHSVWFDLVEAFHSGVMVAPDKLGELYLLHHCCGDYLFVVCDGAGYYDQISEALVVVVNYTSFQQFLYLLPID